MNLTKTTLLIITTVLVSTLVYSQQINFNNKKNALNDAWSFSINPGLGFVVNSHSIPGVNANRIGTNLTGRKYFGNVGLGITGGIMAGNISNDAVNTFLSDRNYPADATVTKSNPSNSYLLFGPAVRFGKKVQFGAELSGGLFLNDVGSLTVTAQGSPRPLYSLENGNKSLYPGFSGDIHIDYPINNSTRFFISTGYLQTKSSTRVLDMQQGIDFPRLQNQDVKLFTAGIGIVKTFGSRRGKGDASDGLSANTDIISPSDGANGLPTGRRTVSANDIHHNSVVESCGPVTIRTTNPDGTVTETTFACPQDAAQFQQRSSSVNSLNNSMPSRLSMTPTTAKQTQGETFGEPIKTSSQSRSILKNLPDSLKKNIIVGKVSRGADNVLGIETNQSIAEKSKPKEDTVIRQKQHADGLFRLPVNGGGPGGGPYVKVWSSDLLLPAVPKFYLTDSKTGNKEWMDDWQKPTVGKTSEAKNSLGAISRIQAPTVGKTSEAKNSLGAISRLQAPTAGKTSEVKNSTGETGYFDIEWPELKVSLLDASSGTVLATTLTEPDGQFFFANLPSGTFAVKVEGSISTISQYDVTLNKKANFGGVIKATNENWSVELNTGTGTAEQAAAYVQKTRTKANNSNDRLMGNTNDNSGLVWSPRSNFKVLPKAIGDVDRDGLEEMVIGTGVIADITDGAVARPGNPIGGIIVKGGKNPGGSMFTTTTNSNGEFEFTNLQPGSYTFTMEGTLEIDDVTMVEVGDDTTNDDKSRKGWDGTVKGGSKLVNEPEERKHREPPTESYNPWEIDDVSSKLKTLNATLDELKLQMDNAVVSDNKHPDGSYKTAYNKIKDIKVTITNIQKALENQQQKTEILKRKVAELQEVLKTMGPKYKGKDKELHDWWEDSA